MVLTGEKDIFGKAFNSTTMATAEAAGSTWSGGTWNGSSWAGSSWAGSSWAGSTWSGSSWAGKSWAGSSWSGNSWSGQLLVRQQLVRQQLVRQLLVRQHLVRRQLELTLTTQRPTTDADHTDNRGASARDRTSVPAGLRGEPVQPNPRRRPDAPPRLSTCEDHHGAISAAVTLLPTISAAVALLALDGGTFAHGRRARPAASAREGDRRSQPAGLRLAKSLGR